MLQVWPPVSQSSDIRIFGRAGGHGDGAEVLKAGAVDVYHLHGGQLQRCEARRICEERELVHTMSDPLTLTDRYYRSGVDCCRYANMDRR